MMRVLFVCLGNICRSPTAEAVLRAKRPEWEIDSAGTAGWHVGKAPYGPMQAAAAPAGFPMRDLRARQFQEEDFERFDLILGMDANNLADIEDLRPPGAQTRVCGLADYVDSVDHVPDPYYTRDFGSAVRLIEDCVDALVAAEEASFKP